MTDSLIQEKVTQAQAILNELGIDTWLLFARETSAVMDPMLPVIYGSDLTWQSALFINRSGKHVAIVGNFEAEAAHAVGAYGEVIPYHQSIREPLLQKLREINPQKIAIDYSVNDSHADGLTYGMYQLLLSYLKGSPYINRLGSAELLVSALRGRKTSNEIKRIRKAIKTTEEIYSETFNFLKAGMTEEEIGQFMQSVVDRMGLVTAWQREHCPAVNAGPNSPVGHAGPTKIQLEHGQLVHFDFGVKQNDYCSDIQRMVYLLRPGEISPPAEVTHGFKTITDAIQKAVAAMKPGVSGLAIDQITRSTVTSAGYPEYMYATGHHLGRTVHDGAGILGPMWERYGETPTYLLQPGNVYTVEPGLMVPGYGYIGLEEDVLVTETGAEFLGPPQTELRLI
jgi:Xaa-Pro aminopeptidase